jgi:hypothetical protein
LMSGTASQMSAAIPILSGVRRPSNTKNAAGNRSASKETVARTAALRLRDVMTLPFVVFFIDQRGFCRRGTYSQNLSTSRIVMGNF